jgi:SAM-dependent methyltransferase
MSISKSVDTKGNDYVSSLEGRLGARSDRLEEIHMEAAIDAQLTDTTTDSSAANPVIAPPVSSAERQETIFDDYVNPNAVSNCLSPYVPSQAERIAAFVSFAGLEADDFLLDLGCGDGRVCIAASTIAGCRTAGIDVSPPCIGMANEVAREEGLSESQCAFFEADATIDPDILLAGEWMPPKCCNGIDQSINCMSNLHFSTIESSPLSKMLRSVTVIYLYTYPTLLQSLVPLLRELTQSGQVRAVVTLTYHLSSDIATVQRKDETHEFQLYSRIR